jgi:S1-C subfamily serine protease
MNKTLLKIALMLAAAGLTAACSKTTDNNTDAKIQQMIDQTKANNQAEVEKIKSEFEQMQKNTNHIVDEALAAVQKTTLNYVGKVVRVDILDDQGKTQKSYLDFFELDAVSGSYKSKFENLMYMDAAGICVNIASLDCETTYNYQTLVQNFGTVSAGRFKMTDINKAHLSGLPALTFKSTAKVVQLERDFMVLELKAVSTMVVSDRAPSKKIKISTLGKLSQEKHNFAQLTEDKSDRKDLSTVADDLKKLSLATVQVLINSEGGSMLHGGSSGHGTGFFISEEGLMLTNNHVIAGLVDCVQFHKCKVALRRIDSDNKASVFSVDAQLLATDVDMDFALLKITVPEEMKIESFEIETQEVDADLMSLGYPGDRGDSRDTTPLSYSFGKLVGTIDLGYTTSVYIAGGASGSALLNQANKKVVAIISNGNNPAPGEDGAPGIARPLQMINAEFGIDDYLSGSKETRIIKILQMLKVSATASDAQSALEAFDNERTYLGLGVMKSIMLSHQDVAVRKMIMQYLEKRVFIMGPDEEP